MPYDATLAARICEILDSRPDIETKNMFGGICLLLRGNICVGVWHESLIVRVGADAYEEALLRPHTGEFDITGRPMRGWVMVEPLGTDEDASLRAWIERALVFVEQLPAK